jgi:hypothetical protein
LSPAYAKRVLDVSAYSQIINGGSNFGELLGALSVFVLSNRVTTPLPWLRLDALMLNLVWLVPHFATRAVKKDVNEAWKLAGCFIPVSFGWAAGDVSLAAYIQGVLSEKQFAGRGISALGSVMAFLYTSYIVLYAALGVVFGRVIDKDLKAHQNIFRALKLVGGVQFSVGCAIILLACFIPKGAFAFNPKMLGGGSPPPSPPPEEEEGSQEGSDTVEKEKAKAEPSAA